MNNPRTAGDLHQLVDELRKISSETPWVEFKQNYADPEDIGQYVSALSNSAALHGKAAAYLVWGVENETHQVVGTAFRPFAAKKGEEFLQNWLLRLLNPRIHFAFSELEHHGKHVALLEIPRAMGKPVQFQGVEFIRVGSYRQKLRDYPEIERELWRVFDQVPFEDLIAAERCEGPEVLRLIDYPTYFELLALPLPADRETILLRLYQDRLITKDDGGAWNITNLGAVLFARDLDDFKTLSRKRVRVIVYDGQGRLKTVREQVGKKGYASGFAPLIEFVRALLPRNEVVAKALRKDVPMYPDLAVRELVANALIHQDFSISGSGPMIEIFDSRMEITNPGLPLVKTERFLDTPPRSRNEVLASLMRRFGICEERGSGVDRVVSETEHYQLPAPVFETPEGCTRAILFAHKTLTQMDKADRTRACYLHACLRYVQRDPMTNSSLRERFRIDAHNSATASRIIGDAISDEWIKPHDPKQGKKFAKYVPFWPEFYLITACRRDGPSSRRGLSIDIIY